MRLILSRSQSTIWTGPHKNYRSIFPMLILFRLGFLCLIGRDWPGPGSPGIGKFVREVGGQCLIRQGVVSEESLVPV